MAFNRNKGKFSDLTEKFGDTADDTKASSKKHMRRYGNLSHLSDDEYSAAVTETVQRKRANEESKASHSLETAHEGNMEEESGILGYESWRGNLHHNTPKKRKRTVRTSNGNDVFHEKEPSFREEYSHHDFKDKDGQYINPVYENGHDKLAQKKTVTDAGGGATIKNKFDKNGEVYAAVTLHNPKGFRKRVHGFTDKAEDIFEDVSMGRNDAAISNVDERAGIYFEHSARRFKREASRYREAEEGAENEKDAIAEELGKVSAPVEITDKKEDIFNNKNGKKDENADENIFKKSNAKFSEYIDNFMDTCAAKFSSSPAAKGKNSILQKDKGAAKHLPVTQPEKKVNQKAVSELVAEKNSNVHTDSNLQKRDVESHFNNDSSKHDVFALGEPNSGKKVISDREIAREEKFTQAKAREKKAKEEKKKKLKKAGAMAALSQTLFAKGNLQNDFADVSGQGTGDLIKDGSSGLLRTAIDGIGTAVRTAAKAISMQLLAILASVCSILILPACIILVIFVLMSGTTAALVGADSDSGEEYDLSLQGGDGLTYTSLSDDDIDSIIGSLYGYGDGMSERQERVLRYALSKVGCRYNQNYHGSLTADIFDCSSLAYRAYREVGIDIANGDAYSAAEECRAMENRGKVVGNSLLPGDLIFYGGADNNRYRGIYHVAIYVGYGKMVEAKGRSYGVVYGDVRENNVVVCARPYM